MCGPASALIDAGRLCGAATPREVSMEFVIAIYILVAAVGAYQILVPYKYLPPYTPEELERIAYLDDIIANSSSEDS